MRCMVKILIVDDDEMALAMLENMLIENGYTVVKASNGQDALKILHETNCRLVISDWQMPHMDGLELCRAIRDDDTLGYTYFILLTGNEAKDSAVTGLSAGADDFISKPFNPAELAVRIRAGERIISLETREVAIFAMAKLAESRDPETGVHLERIQSYCRILARELYDQKKFPDIIDRDFIRMIYITSPLHDIGKVGIPDCVLMKPGRLSDREFEIMKEHSMLGGETLGAALKQFPGTKFLQMARDIAFSHHEWYNGNGYPRGLAGDDIPLSGRIVAVADVYDALTSRRVYKKAFAHEVAKGIIVEESGTHFDPVIVETFLSLEQQFIDVREKFIEEELLCT